jgi:hypothetical protein
VDGCTMLDWRIVHVEVSQGTALQWKMVSIVNMKHGYLAALLPNIIPQPCSTTDTISAPTCVGTALVDM